MNRHQHIRLMAAYNAGMNTKLYDAASTLPEAELNADKKAFFGSILGTLNHLIVADTIWLKRFANHPAHYGELTPIIGLLTPNALDQQLFTDLPSLSGHRQLLDNVIVNWAAAVTEADLDHVLAYTSIKGISANKVFLALSCTFSTIKPTIVAKPPHCCTKQV